MLTVPHIIDLGIQKIPLTDVLFPSFFFSPNSYSGDYSRSSPPEQAMPFLPYTEV